MHPAYAATVSQIGHGHIQELIDLGLRPEWIVDPDVRVFVEAAMSVFFRNSTPDNPRPAALNPTNVLGRARVTDYRPIIEAWKDGFGTTPQDAVDWVKAEYQKQNAQEVYDEFGKLLRERPRDIRKWLPEMEQKIRSVVRTGSAYSAKPSDHMKNPLPRIVQPFKSRTLNEVFRGGLWSHVFVGISAPSGHGKTTLTNTIAAEVVYSAPNLPPERCRTVIVSGEMPEQYYVSSFLCASGVRWENVLKFSETGPDDSEQGTIYKNALAWADQYLSVYGGDWMSLRKIEQMIDVENPALLIVDHIQGMAVESKDANTAQSLGALARGLEDLSVKYACMVIAFSQLSDTRKSQFIATHDLESFSGYGSGGIEQAVRLGVLMSLHWAKPDVQYFRVKKNSLPPPADRRRDTEHEMAYNPDQRVYVDIEQEYTLEL